MFKKNKKHLQTDIFAGDPFALKDAISEMEDTEEYFFYKTVFCNLDEDLFAPLYCSDNGRVNSAINAMVCGLFLKEKLNLSYDEFFKNLKYNLLLRVSLGLFSLGKIPFCRATLFNFVNRMKAYQDEHGINLFEQVFKELTKKQLADLEIKANIARTDSFLVDSNIRFYGRLELLIEVLLRFYRVFSDSDKELFLNKFTDYYKKGSQKYIYGLKGSDICHEKSKIAEAYLWINTFIAEKYNESNEYNIFCRVYKEHFRVDESHKLNLKDSKELGSNCLQSPDDPDATYRNKRNKEHKGQVASVTETADPEKNDINLIIDIGISPNNIDDSKILNERLDSIVEMAPDIEELHFDGGYGSKENDKKMEELNIVPVQTAIRGRKPAVEFEIKTTDNNQTVVICPGGQQITANRTDTGWKAVFDIEMCNKCSNKNKCPAFKSKNPGGTYYFKDEDKLKHKRFHSIKNLPLERRKLRANVEATMQEFVHHLRGHKLKVRSTFKTSLFVYSIAIMVNFGRIFRRSIKNEKKINHLLFFWQIIKSYLRILCFKKINLAY